MYFVTDGDICFPETNMHYQMSSFSETTAFGYLRADPIDFVKYPSVTVESLNSLCKTLEVCFSLLMFINSSAKKA